MNTIPEPTNARKSFRHAPKDDRLALIYHTAAEIIDRNGYDATSLQDIARAVGLTKAGFYHYISSKERLLFEIMNYAMDRVVSHVITPARAIDDAEERMRTIIANYAHLIIANGQQITLIINEASGLTPAHHRQVTERRRAFYEFVRETIEQLKDERKFAGVDVTVTALSLFGIMMWLAHWYRPDGRLTRQEVVKEITELTIGRMLGLKPRGRQRKTPKGRKQSPKPRAAR
jgi:AcrR family transcriptional regulator